VYDCRKTHSDGMVAYGDMKGGVRPSAEVEHSVSRVGFWRGKMERFERSGMVRKHDDEVERRWGIIYILNEFKILSSDVVDLPSCLHYESLASVIGLCIRRNRNKIKQPLTDRKGFIASRRLGAIETPRIL